jgi:phytanoyl-CoA hydroxylase
MNTTESVAHFDPGTQDHAPELYLSAGTAIPLQGLKAFDEAAAARYHRDGYLAIEGVFNQAEIDAAQNGLNDLVMGIWPDFKGIIYESKARDILPTLSLEDRIDATRRFMGFVGYEARLAAIAEHQPLMKIVAKLLDEPPVLFQDMALIKPPRIGREKPWHQDHAYFNFPLGTRIIGIWIALDAATVDNGCMCVLPGEHRTPRHHFQRRDWQICDTEMQGNRPLAVPLSPGGLLLFDGLIPHGTPTNFSPLRRRALQFHYRNVSAQPITQDERMAIFGTEGKDVTC